MKKIDAATWWFAMRLLFSPEKKILSTTGWVSLSGLVLGVGSLFVAMAVISGFENTLMRAVSDVVGHLQISKSMLTQESWESVEDKIQRKEKAIIATNRFSSIDGVLAHKGKVRGIRLQGVDPINHDKVLGLRQRLMSGEMKMNSDDKMPVVLIGKGVAEDFHLKVGDEFRVIVPQAPDIDVHQFQRKVGLFKVGGILELGKHEYNERWIIAAMDVLQRFSDSRLKTGMLVKVSDPQIAREMKFRLRESLGSGFHVSDWKEVNENLFAAVKIEKVVIFFVIFVIVVAAAFNVASSLYINVVKSFPDIAILKALGMGKRNLIQIFSIQGLVLGIIGSFLGILFGAILCYGFLFLQRHFPIIQSEIYKIDHIDIDIRLLDLSVILLATIGVCFLATLPPAKRGAGLTTVEGLRNE